MGTRDAALRAKELVEHASAIAAVHAADTLAKYLARKRPDLAESVQSIRYLGAAIQRSIPAIKPGEFGTFEQSFRHAVCLVDEDGRYRRRSPDNEALAAELLAEYGEARGGYPVHWHVALEDYGNVVVYVMSFNGGPTEPAYETRLTGTPVTGNEQLVGRVERWPHWEDTVKGG